MVTQPQLQRQILEEVQQLTPDEQLTLIQELIALYQRQARKPRHSLLELEGLGAETWKGIDPQKYVDEERNSWDG